MRTAIEQELEIKANNQALLDLFPPGGVYSDEDYERGIAMEEALDRFTGSRMSGDPIRILPPIPITAEELLKQLDQTTPDNS